MKKSHCILAVLSVFLATNAHSQQVFSLIDMNKMVLDPAFTATDTSFKNTVSLYDENYQDRYTPDMQSTNIIGTYQLQLDKINSGAGIMINYNYNNFYLQTTTQIAAKLYYRYTVLPGLSIGADAGFVSMQNNYQLDGWSSVDAATVYTGTLNNFDWDGGVGLLYQFKWFYAGFSVDHITKPEESIPMLDYTNNVESIQTPMVNYTGIAYNCIVGSNIPIGKCGIDISASYRSNYPNFNATVEVPHFFFGVSAIADFNDGRSFNSTLSHTNYISYYAFIAGIKVYHNKIKVTVAYDYYLNFIYPQLQNPNLQPFEMGINYSF